MKTYADFWGPKTEKTLVWYADFWGPNMLPYDSEEDALRDLGVELDEDFEPKELESGFVVRTYGDHTLIPEGANRLALGNDLLMCWIGERVDRVRVGSDRNCLLRAEATNEPIWDEDMVEMPWDDAAIYMIKKLEERGKDDVDA